jgi:hypothetical protein
MKPPPAFSPRSILLWTAVFWTLSKDGLAPTAQGSGELQDGLLTVTGSSQGGAQALVAAGLDSRVTFLQRVCP